MGRWLGILWCAVMVGCHGDEQCKDWAAGNDGVSGWSQCGDKRAREVKCDGVVRGALATPGKPASCTCTVDGVVGKKFEITDPSAFATLESATKIANEQCGWHVSR
jgi:hypothetical protein